MQVPPLTNSSIFGTVEMSLNSQGRRLLSVTGDCTFIFITVYIYMCQRVRIGFLPVSFP